MNFPEAIQVKNDINIPKLATATGIAIVRSFLYAKIASALAISEIVAKIRAPVWDAITHSLIITHSLFRTNPKVVTSLPGFKKPKYSNESDESNEITNTP
jgi:hypothetical protein